jgi:pimeloyl-ACP methyl ester carboxylesterase
MPRPCAVSPLLVAACLLSGCALTAPAARNAMKPIAADRPADAGPVTTVDGTRIWFPDRLDRGLIIVLPGAWGDMPVSRGLVTGLVDSDVAAAVEFYDWTAGHWSLWPVMMPYNVRALDRNRGESRAVAAKIVAYRKQYPGRPVHLVGYSGGGAVAVLALESLPEEHRATSAVLLAPSLAYNYNLQPALQRTERGIENFYSHLDIPVMFVTGTAMGTSDGKHLPPAGAVGFHPSVEDDRLRQHGYGFAMLPQGHAGGHFGWAGRRFIAENVAPLVNPAVADRVDESSPSARDLSAATATGGRESNEVRFRPVKATDERLFRPTP